MASEPFEPDSSDPDRLHWDEYVAEGKAAREAADGAQWELGALAGTIETTYGAGDLQKYAAAIDVEYNTLRVYRAVAKQFAPRGSNVPYTVYKMLLGRSDAATMLQRVIDKGLSTRELQREIDMRTPRVQAPGKPTPKALPPRYFSRIEGLERRLVVRRQELDLFREQLENSDRLDPRQSDGLVNHADEEIEFWTGLRDRILNDRNVEDGRLEDGDEADGITRERFEE